MNLLKLMILFTLTIFAGCTISEKTATNSRDKATVYTTFIVDSSGNVTNVNVAQVDCFECPDSSIRKMIKEAKEAVSGMDKFKTARDSNGQHINVKFNLPIVFDKTKY